MSKKPFFILFFFILILGGMLRFYKLGQVPTSLYWDETAMLADARFVSETGRDIHGNYWWQTMFISYGDYKLPVYIWLATLSVKALGVSELALRFPSALVGMLTIIVGGLIAKELNLFDKNLKKIAFLCTAFIIAVSPWSILFSRTAFEGHVGQFFLGLAILISLWANKKVGWKSYPFLILAQVVAAIATYTYFSVRFVWPVVFMTLILIEMGAKQFLKNKSIFIKKLILKLFLLLIYVLLLTPMFLSPVYKASNQFRLSTTSVLNMKDWAVESNKLRELAGNTVIDRVFYHRHILMSKELLKNFSDNLSIDFLFISGDPNLRHGTGRHGLYLFVFMPFLFAGLYYLYQNNKSGLFLLIIWWIISLLPASVPDTTPHALRSLNALIPLSVIIGAGLTFTFKKIIINNKSIYLKLITTIYSVLILTTILTFTNYYFSQYPHLSADDWQDGFKELALEIDSVKGPARTVWVNVNDGRYFLWQLAYGDIDLNLVQNYMANKHEPEKISNIVFTQFDLQKLDTLDHKLVVVGEKKEIESHLETASLKPTWVRNTRGYNGEDLYMLVGFGD